MSSIWIIEDGNVSDQGDVTAIMPSSAVNHRLALEKDKNEIHIVRHKALSCELKNMSDNDDGLLDGFMAPKADFNSSKRFYKRAE